MENDDQFVERMFPTSTSGHNNGSHENVMRRRVRMMMVGRRGRRGDLLPLRHNRLVHIYVYYTYICRCTGSLIFYDISIWSSYYSL